MPSLYSHPRDDPTPGNFAVGGGFKGDNLKYYDGPVPDSFALLEGTLLITMTDLRKIADTLGFPAIVPKATYGRYHTLAAVLNALLPKLLSREIRVDNADRIAEEVA